METNQFYIHVNGHTLTVDLKENSSVQAIINELKSGDITIPMKDYANFEKFGKLPRSFPRNDEQITTESGDVILSEGNLLVIYYDRNSWNFTRLGKIHNLSQSELKKILGSGNVTVTVSLNSDK
ncbi:cyclophilin-like fold protein [Bacteroides finegoldii]|uniref:cyclophilin-like fold protein n=1 Tax=Bacteroides finegoldii TaxID=338188 RepID=UPI00189CA859|nr:cyclophilin-like fold protein [Bacteroides finegoldii]